MLDEIVAKEKTGEEFNKEAASALLSPFDRDFWKGTLAAVDKLSKAAIPI